MNTGDKEISFRDLRIIIRDWWKYLLSKLIWLFSIALIFAILGALYAWTQKPVYTAELTFSAENTNASGLGSYAGLAAQFGVDLAGGGGTVFEGENLVQLLKSRLLVEKTLLTPVTVDGKKDLLINYLIRVNEMDKSWSKQPNLPRIQFATGPQPPLRARDSIMKNISNQIREGALDINKLEKNLSIVSIRMSSSDELFAKLFVENLADNAIQYYIDYKIKKTRQNVEILQHQTDSIRRLLTGNIVSVAVSNDLNVNPVRQVVRANVQRKQVDVQVNSQVYGELLKQLEFSKITLRKETPLIQLIDTPRLPLDKKKMGRLKGAILFGFIGGMLTAAVLILKRLMS